MTPAERARAKAFREAARIRETLFGKQVVAKSRTATSNVDSQRLNARTGRQLRILAPGNGAEAEDVGGFWYVPGYSMLGGPDVVPDS